MTEQRWEKDHFTSSVLDATREPEVDITMLETVAEIDDEAAFLREAKKVDWLKRPAADFAQGVRLALAAGAHLFARKLACQGAQLYPDHEELQKMAYILSPPRVVRTVPADPSVRANQAWLRDHADEYKGKWVVIQNGNLVAVGQTAREAWNSLENKEGVMLTRVF